MVFEFIRRVWKGGVIEELTTGDDPHSFYESNDETYDEEFAKDVRRRRLRLGVTLGESLREEVENGNKRVGQEERVELKSQNLQDASHKEEQYQLRLPNSVKSLDFESLQRDALLGCVSICFLHEGEGGEREFHGVEFVNHGDSRDHLHLLILMKLCFLNGKSRLI